jgi:hypothetical protein
MLQDPRYVTVLLNVPAHLFDTRKRLGKATEFVPAALHDVLWLAGELHQVALERSAVVIKLWGSCTAYWFATALNAQQLRSTRLYTVRSDGREHRSVCSARQDEREGSLPLPVALFMNTCSEVCECRTNLSGVETCTG